MYKNYKGWDWRPVGINNGCEDYCMKTDTRIEGPWEFGTRLMKRNNKTDWDTVYSYAK